MRWEPIAGNSPEIHVANALRKMAERAHPNSARSFAKRIESENLRPSLVHQTVTNVLNGTGSTSKLQNVAVVASAIAHGINGLNLEERSHAVQEIVATHQQAFRSSVSKLPKIRDITNHCLAVAFDWASSLPDGPRNALEVIATVALRESEPQELRTEVFDAKIDHEIQFEVMEGSQARSMGKGGWNDRRDDGPTWHGMWGPVVQADDDDPKWFLAVHLDAVGAVSIYIRAVVDKDAADLLGFMATLAALRVLELLNWTGEAGVLVKSASPSPAARKSELFTKYQRSGWRSLSNGTVSLPVSTYEEAARLERLRDEIPRSRPRRSKRLRGQG
jgi:hypothetical protein